MYVPGSFLPPSSMLKTVAVVFIEILLNINQNAWCHIPQDGYFIDTPVTTSVLKVKTCMRFKNYNMRGETSQNSRTEPYKMNKVKKKQKYNSFQNTDRTTFFGQT